MYECYTYRASVHDFLFICGERSLHILTPSLLEGYYFFNIAATACHACMYGALMRPGRVSAE